jgi:hypothetical protein
MRRREFITLVGGSAVAWPLGAHVEQPAIPVIGYLDSRSPAAVENRLRGFHQGLKEAGYIEGENVNNPVPVGRRSIGSVCFGEPTLECQRSVAGFLFGGREPRLRRPRQRGREARPCVMQTNPTQ